MNLSAQAALTRECGQQHQDSLRAATSQAVVQQPDHPLQGCPAPQTHVQEVQAGSQDASLLLDATTLHGMLQQPPLESSPVAEATQQITMSRPASRPGSAGSQEHPRRRRKQLSPASAADSSPVACLATHAATAEAQQGLELEKALALPETMATLQAPDALQPACATVDPIETADRGRLCHKSSTDSSLVSASSRSLGAEILAKVASVLSSNRLQAAAASSKHLEPAGTAQAASASPAEGTSSSREVCSDAEEELKALLQGGTLQQLAALLSSEDSEIGSDFSDDSGASASGNGSGDGAAHSSQQASSYVEQDQVASQFEVPSQLGHATFHIVYCSEHSTICLPMSVCIVCCLQHAN